MKGLCWLNNQMGRNHGCRIKQYSSNGQQKISLENEKLLVLINLDQGAQIEEFLYKPKDIDVMFHFPYQGSMRKPYKEDAANGFLNAYCGGWQELFPNISQPCMVKGAVYGMHGEVARLSWECEIIEDSEEKVEVNLSVQTIKTPYQLNRRMWLLKDNPTLYLEETIENLAYETMEFQWGHHPALGGRFLDDSCEILIEGNPKINAYDIDLGDSSQMIAGSTGIWPDIQGKNGTLHLNQVQKFEEREYREFSLSDLKEGTFKITNHNYNLSFGMDWDKSVFPYLWVWQMYGGGYSYPFYGRAYALALEPWSSLPGNLEECIRQGTTIKLDAGKSITTRLTAWVKEES